MTHLYIEQNTGLTEEVDINLITKLYETVTNNTLDETSDLKGRLHTPSAKDIHVSYLTTHFPELYITADIQYITFADPYIEEYMRNYIGDGTGTIQTHIQSFISSGRKFGEAYNNPYLGNGRNWPLTYDLKILPTTFNEFGTLFEGITKINTGAFNEFRNLTSITIPSTVIELGLNTFRNTFALTSLNNLENVQIIGGNAFQDSHIGGDISLPNLTYLGGGSFSGTRITSISLPATTKLEGDGTFSSCSNLTQVTGLSTNTNCKSSTFNGCSNLETIDIDFSIVTHIGNNTFESCQKLNLGNLVLPSLTSLGSWTFGSCKKLYSVDLSSSSITKLYNGAFTGCSNLTTVVLPASCTMFDGREVFQNCSSLTSINTGNITSFGNNNFYGCTNLQSVDFSSVTSIGIRCFSGSGITGSINIPNYSGPLYEYAFYGTNITSISLSSNCTSIQQSVFEGCSNLQTISNIGGVQTLGQRAFLGCSNLDITDWDLSNITSLGQYSFNGCNKLKGTLNLSGVQTLNGLYAELFKNCYLLTKIILGNPGTIGGNYANATRSPFYGCNSLKIIDITQLDTISMCLNCIIESDVFEALIIRNSTTVPTVEKQQNYSGALRFDKIIKNSNARIYVPRAMLSTYTNDSEWSAISSYILAVEDYTPSV